MVLASLVAATKIVSALSIRGGAQIFLVDTITFSIDLDKQYLVELLAATTERSALSHFESKTQTIETIFEMSKYCNLSTHCHPQNWSVKSYSGCHFTWDFWSVKRLLVDCLSVVKDLNGKMC